MVRSRVICGCPSPSDCLLLPGCVRVRRFAKPKDSFLCRAIKRMEHRKAPVYSFRDCARAKFAPEYQPTKRTCDGPNLFPARMIRALVHSVPRIVGSLGHTEVPWRNARSLNPG